MRSGNARFDTPSMESRRALVMAKAQVHGSWREHFVQVEEAVYASHTANRLAFGRLAAARAAEQLSGVTPFGLRRRGLMSTWGEQFVLLDGAIVLRDEPETWYATPIDGALIVGDLTMRWVCQHGRLDPTGLPEIPLEWLDAAISWQLSAATSALEKVYELAKSALYIEHGREIRNLVQELNHDLLPDVASIPARPVPNHREPWFEVPWADEVDFFARLVKQPVRDLQRDEAGSLHLQPCHAAAGRFEWIPQTPVRALDPSTLCTECGDKLSHLLQASQDAVDTIEDEDWTAAQLGDIAGAGKQADALIVRSIFNWDTYRPGRTPRSVAAVDGGAARTIASYVEYCRGSGRSALVDVEQRDS